ncbi:MAG: Gfo/Idh/MocA family oxidoreductase [Candidatus Sumerlaeota bacterium]|nr:Gfo/Idh/MocA family oxidoreductase [Candidatus Sumerlaeota bacterium]
MARYKAVICGCGPRGLIHAQGFLANADRFDLAALCDLDPTRLQKAAAQTGSHGVKTIAYEKPVAVSLEEARQIRDACRAAGVRTIVSHQQKYGPHWQKLKALVDAGEIGELRTIHATSKAWLLQLGTHLVDYCMWYNGARPARWVLGQVHGKNKFTDSHPSPDYALGRMEFDNGVGCILECGTLAPETPETDKFWLKDAVNLYGAQGWGRVVTGGGWSAMTRSSGGAVLSGEGVFDPRHEQPLYIKELADWLDGKIERHCCDGELAYHGFEICMGILLSALERRRVDLPIDPMPSESIYDQLGRVLPVVPYEGEK